MCEQCLCFCYLFSWLYINYSPLDIVILVSFIFITLSKGSSRSGLVELHSQNSTAELVVEVQPVNDVVQFWQIFCYHATKTHAEIISNAGITFSGYEKTGGAAIPGYFYPHSLRASLAQPGGVQIIKMATVMGLITLIVQTTTQTFHWRYHPPIPPPATACRAHLDRVGLHIS